MTAYSDRLAAAIDGLRESIATIGDHDDVVQSMITNGDLNNPETDDVLDDLSEYVLKTGGEVVIVPAERMPTRTGAAAIYRF